jgi:hypothetical protein
VTSAVGAVTGARPRTWAVLLAGAVILAACTGAEAEPGDPGASGAAAQPSPAVPVHATSAPLASAVLPGGSPSDLSVQASRAVWAASPAAITVVAGSGEVDAAAEQAEAVGVPLLVLPDTVGQDEATGAEQQIAPGVRAVADELDRLGATHVLHVGAGAPDLPDVEVVATAADLPGLDPVDPVQDVVGVTVAGRTGEGTTAALATLRAAGAEVVAVGNADPRVDPDDVAVVAAADPGVALGVGARFGPSEVFAQRIEAAATGVQLPGGGQTVFDGKRYIALYGHPLTGGLGVLGEQGPKGSVARVRQVAAQYEGLSGEAIVPAFEIIATVAAGGAGDDGNYSNEWDVEVLRPLVDAAADAGIYVVLDLQSGRSDFLSQAMLYEEFLREPHVGLALDPEWRLKKGELPLRQIGSVGVREINRTMAWLAELTDQADLPQKMVLLHQFRTDMILNRQNLDLSHDELAVIVQMDGDGTLGQKLDTWQAIRAGAPSGLRFGWKNFYDEDEPTPSPATTFSVEPTPWWVSYQ